MEKILKPQFFRNYFFHHKLTNNQLNISGLKPFPGRITVFNGDDGLKLKTFLMRPFPTDVTIRDDILLIDDIDINYNKRLSRAKRIIESIFSILVRKSKSLFIQFELNIKIVVDVVKARLRRT